MTIDLSNPAHVKSLRHVCKRLIRTGEDAQELASHYESIVSVEHNQAEFRLDALAARALSSPALSASLLRALLERCGVDLVMCLPDKRVDPVAALVVPREAACSRIYTVALEEIPALILALLDIPADAQDRREMAMAALKEHGR
jgi:hypothetical protein